MQAFSLEEITLLDSFHLEEFVAIDLETTGLDPTTESIIEISAVKFIDGIEKETFSYLIDPGKLISPFIEDLTGITNQMVQGKPQFSDVIDDFIIFKDVIFILLNKFLPNLDPFYLLRIDISLSVLL